MNPTLIVIIIAILFTVIVFFWRTGFWRWLVNLTRIPTPTPTPEPETDENLSEEQRLMRNWLGDVVTEQRETVSQLDRIRKHLEFYTVIILIGIIVSIFVVITGVY